MDDSNTRPVLMGTCGWSDDTLARCGHFYPSSAKSAVDRLRHYSRQYPCVEIDTSTYAIPRVGQVREWMAAVPKGFIFHMKVFGLFPSRSVAPAALPRDIRASFLSGTELEERPAVRLSELSKECVDALWQRMNDAAGVLADAGMLGCVVFQFHGTFTPTQENIDYVCECRRRLRPDLTMAVEFRSRDWYSSGRVVAEASDAACAGLGSLDAHTPAHAHIARSQRDATLACLRRLGIVNIGSDDLVEEFPSHEPRVPGYRDGRAVVYDHVTAHTCAYVRLHRRRGTDRILPQAEIDEWSVRMQQMAATGQPEPFHWIDPALPHTERVGAPPDHPWTWTHLRGPIYFMIGTDHEDQPMRNMAALAAAITRDGALWEAAVRTHGRAATGPHGIPLQVRTRLLNWKAIASTADAKTGLRGFFTAAAAASPAAHAGEKRAADADAGPDASHKAARLVEAAPPVPVIYEVDDEPVLVHAHTLSNTTGQAHALSQTHTETQKTPTKTPSTPAKNAASAGSLLSFFKRSP